MGTLYSPNTTHMREVFYLASPTPRLAPNIDKGGAVFIICSLNKVFTGLNHGIPGSNTVRAFGSSTPLPIGMCDAVARIAQARTQFSNTGEAIT